MRRGVFAYSHRATRIPETDKKGCQTSTRLRKPNLSVFTMTVAPLLLVVLYHLTGSWGQFQLTQPNSVSGPLKSTVTISCKLNSGDIGRRYVHWYQQHSGRPPTPVIYNDDKRPSGIPDRFSGSIDSSSNSASLTIGNVQNEDEADYYCETRDNDYSHSDANRGGSETKTPQSSSCEIIS